MVGRSPWWDPRFHADRRPLLAARGRIAAGLRGYFGGHGFTEVEAAILQVSPGNEAHLHAFATELVAPDGRRARRFLHTSPEFAMKKLLAAGEERIFDFARVFRNREAGPLHAPEFTMLEWYRAREPYDTIMADTLAVIATAARAAGASSLTWRGRTADPFADAERISVAEAFARFAGIDLLSRLGDRDRLAFDAANAGLRVAERFELYACGVELANGFAELTDPAEQRRRFTAEMDEKQRVYGERYPIDEGFLDALATLRDQAEAAVRAGQCVIVDAVHRLAAERQEIGALARRVGAAFTGIWLDAPLSVLVERVSARGGDASDATAEIVRRQVMEPLDSIDWNRLDASMPLEALSRAAIAAIGGGSPRDG
jgi:lysyl-tRNA synthetase class 2